jgi:hypothetical protein
MFFTQQIRAAAFMPQFFFDVSSESGLHLSSEMPERGDLMYRIEEFKNRTPMKAYHKDYENGQGFLGYCEKKTGYDQIWSCPLYDFNPEGYRKKYKYLYIIGKRIIFEQTADERYVNQVCLEEKENLTKKIKNLKKSHPDSLAVSAGSCHVCSWCRRAEGRGCRYSDDIRRFIEFIGGNAGETAGEVLAIEMKWMKQKLPESLTLINGLLTNDPRIEF